MMAQSIHIAGVGLVTSVGHTTASTCAALRCRLNNFAELDFTDSENEPLIGAAVEMEASGSGVEKLTAMALSAIRQALRPFPELELARLPVLLCVAEPSRSGRLTQLEERLRAGLESQLGHALDASSEYIATGQTSVSLALLRAGQLLDASGPSAVLIVAADTYLNRATIIEHLAAQRLLATDIRAGFIPGEAAGALLVMRTDALNGVELRVFGHGLGTELALRDNAAPLRADGVTQAVQSALDAATSTIDELSVLISDASGEDYSFEQLGLVQQRTGATMPLWLPAETVGETGSAVGCIQVAWWMEAYRKSYLTGNGALLMAGNDAGQRTATILAFHFSQDYIDSAIDPATMIQETMRKDRSNVA